MGKDIVAADGNKAVGQLHHEAGGSEADYIFGRDDDTLQGLVLFAKDVARGIQKATDCKRVGMAVLGMEVNHVHIHLIPLDKETDMLFSNPKLKLSSEEMAEIANSIAVAIDGAE